MQSKFKFLGIIGFSFLVMFFLNLNTLAKNTKTETATIAGGCFWAMESMFQKLNGVISVDSGYAGGFVKNPSYEEVCTAKTGHAETINIVFDPNKISYAKILDIFWKVHNPTTLNRQDNDEGPQYRSAIFYRDKKQKETAQKSKADLTKSGFWSPSPVVTEINAFTNFYKAEAYHKNYFTNHPNEPYTMSVVAPKVEKFQKNYKSLLK